MKSFFSVLIILFVLIGCESSTGNMQLTGNIEGLRKGTLLLQKIEDTSLVTMDSIVIDGNNNFEFSVPVENPEVYYLTMRFNDSLKTERRIPFFAEASEITLNSKLQNFEIESTVTGSVNQEKWDEYIKLMQRYNDKNLDLIEKQFNALKEGKDSILQTLKMQQQNLVSTRYLATVNFAKNNSHFEIAPYLMVSEVYDANLKYHDTIYKLLSPKIKDSKYGKALESLIKDRKTNSSTRR